MKYTPLTGHNDITPKHHTYMTFLKKVYRHEFRKNGFKRISTPLFEEKSFLEQLGEKNYIFDNTSFDLRSQANYGIMRAYLSENFQDEIQPLYLYYVDRFFKKHNEFFEEKNIVGAEVIGEDDPILDAILIYINCRILDKIGLKNEYKVKINSVGIEKEQVKFKEELVSFYESKKNILSDESKKLLEVNPCLILKSKDEDDIILNENAPKMADKFLKKHSKAHFKKVLEYLDLLKVDYSIDNSLVIEKPYQTKTIWKIEAKNGDTLSSGYRYDAMSKMLGEKKEVPATGFSTDMDKLIEILQANSIALKNKDKIDLFFVQLGDEAKEVVLPLSIKARAAGINTVVSLGTPSMKEQMMKAQKSNATYVVIVGIMEARSGVFQVRYQEDGTQEEVKKEELIDYIISKIGTENLNFYSPARDLVIS